MPTSPRAPTHDAARGLRPGVVISAMLAMLVTAAGIAAGGAPSLAEAPAPAGGMEIAAVAEAAPDELPTPAVDPVGATEIRPVVRPDRSDRRASDPDTWVTVASWYGPNFAGRQTANGEIFDPGELTAAHKSLPFGTRVRVTSARTGRSVVVRINDRGPYIAGREFDLSRAAAERIGLTAVGHGPVEVEVLS